MAPPTEDCKRHFPARAGPRTKDAAARTTVEKSTGLRSRSCSGHHFSSEKSELTTMNRVLVFRMTSSDPFGGNSLSAGRDITNLMSECLQDARPTATRCPSKNSRQPYFVAPLGSEVFPISPAGVANRQLQPR